MCELKKEVVTLLKKYGRTRSTKNLRFDILNIKEERYPSLGNFKVSNGWIGKMKKMTLKPQERSIVKEKKEQRLLAWLKKRKQNILSSLVTAAHVKSKWKDIYGSKATEYGLMIFKHKYSIDVVFSQQTGNTNSWIFRK